LIDLEEDEILPTKVVFFSEAISYEDYTFVQEIFVDKPTNVTVRIEVEDSRGAWETHEFTVIFDCSTPLREEIDAKAALLAIANQNSFPAARIVSISQTGLLTIKFSTNMKVPEFPETV